MMQIVYMLPIGHSSKEIHIYAVNPFKNGIENYFFQTTMLIAALIIEKKNRV